MCLLNKSRLLKIQLFFSLILTTSIGFSQLVNNSQFVDPTIGNISKFLVPTYPTFHLPNEMLRMFPVRNDYRDDQITAFPLQVVSHRSKGIMQMKVVSGVLNSQSWNKRMTYDHDLEEIHPWYYSTYLIDDDITLSFVPGKKVAIYKIEFPDDKKNRHLLISGSQEMESKLNKDGSLLISEINKNKSRGIVPNTMIATAYCYAEITDHNGEKISDLNFKSKNSGFSITLPELSPNIIFLKYAISYISFDQAKMNYSMELSDSNMEDLKLKGKHAWDKVLNQIQVEGGTEAQKRTFYTSLYRTYERMIDINEYGKYFSGYDGQVHKSDRPFYVDDWVWDTYHATHPLRCIINPELEGDMLNSYVLMYEQSGWMPTFPQVNGNRMAMNSYHSSAIFTDGYRKGITNYDVEKAYEGIKKNMTEATFIPWRQATPKREIDDFYHKNGYFPALHPNEQETELQVDKFEKRQSVAVTLGISFDNWSLSQLAKDLGKNSDYESFSEKSLSYKQLWHSEEQLFMPKDDKGEWIMIDPKLDGGPGGRDYYDENNGWTYAWDVHHDIDGLIELLGGEKAAEDRLDQLFREPLGVRSYILPSMFPDATGNVGQYSMGNEPSFHIPYLYNYFGTPWKTQKRIRFLIDVWFKDNLFGIPGDEDGGGMTAFVVFSQMGFYPVVPGLPYYTIGSPAFEKLSINLNNGKKFTLLAKGASKKNKYIQKAFLNGKEINTPFFTHEDLMSGGTLELIMAEKPNKEWGIDGTPPFK